jgi:hypothetical protein
MKKLCVFTIWLLALVPLMLQAQIMVAVEDGSPNGSGADLVAQLNDDTWADFTATLVTAADIDSIGELAAYDVVILGGSGFNDADWTLEMANALSEFVNAGGGAILTGWGNFDMQSSDPVNDILEAIFPTQNIPSTNDFDDSGSTLVISQAHPITTGLSDFVVGPGCCTELNPLPVEAGDTVLATMDGSNAGAGSTAVAVKNVGTGFSVYLGPIYMGSNSGYSSMTPGLRSGDPDRLLEQAVVWAAEGEVQIQQDAGFTVTKTFSDGLIANVEVSISCNDGFVSVDTATVSSGGGSHRFVVTDFVSGSMDCDITEAGTEGYASDSCTFTDVTGGEYTCDLFNDAEDGSFSVTKAWDILGQDVDTVDQDVTLVIDCESDISNPAPLPCSSQPDSTQCVWDLDWDGLGLGDSVTASVDVDTSDGDAFCTAYETGIDASEVESSDDCDPRMLVEAAGSNGCTITNTVFFEGIPTLSQYGLALMALLMLGVGMIGFRRFA